MIVAFAQLKITFMLLHNVYVHCSFNYPGELLLVPVGCEMLITSGPYLIQLFFIFVFLCTFSFCVLICTCKPPIDNAGFPLWRIVC